jgi:hypothetical protein
VTLLTPTDGATFTAPATITLTALTADPEGSLKEVKFFANSTLIGAVSMPPHAGTWSAVPAGSYALTAVATDADGGTDDFVGGHGHRSGTASSTAQRDLDRPPPLLPDLRRSISF